jgi:hypothetical protein
MVAQGRRWTVRNHYGNEIYLTDERWKHIIERINHPEMSGYEEHLKETIQRGNRKQDSLNPRKYRYTKAFDDLVEGNTHVVAIVLFRFVVSETGESIPNNYILTAYQKEIE